MPTWDSRCCADDIQTFLQTRMWKRQRIHSSHAWKLRTKPIVRVTGNQWDNVTETHPHEALSLEVQHSRICVPRAVLCTKTSKTINQLLSEPRAVLLGPDRSTVVLCAAQRSAKSLVAAVSASLELSGSSCWHLCCQERDAPSFEWRLVACSIWQVLRQKIFMNSIYFVVD